MENKKLISVENELMKEGIPAIPSMREAIRACIRLSGKLEKQFCWELDIDQAHWSRILSGQGHFPPEKLIPLCEIADNHIPIQWLAYQCGFELRIIPKKLEEQLEQARQEKEEIQRRYENLVEVFRLAGINPQQADMIEK